ncbi:DUF859 family phage minor structural protein [uncultured Streptococcus sp.]|uniref:DUF859 family phage minor structural protein n=1 Tax=uncultured Streptococcus sp. TaxID=83427 RepID=UPI00258E9EAF|nr:DUF859 family phage minor structural protein [uncultured Streptococcus sp.]
MATATFSGQYGHNMTLEVWSGWNRPDTANNRSTVNVQARLRTNGYASMWGVTAPVTVTVDGKSESSNATVNIGTNSSLLFYGKDFVVPHNGDGTKTVGIKISVGLNAGGYGSSMVAFDLPLPTIARASTVNDVTGTLGSAMTININRKNSAFKHTVKYNFGSLSGTIATNVDTSVSWTPPLNLATAMPNKTSDWGNITVETYSGSSKIGSATCRLTLNVPDSVKPTLGSITLTDSNATVKNLLNTANTFAQVMSNIQVTFNNASGAYGSTISSYRAEIVGKNQSTNSNNGFLGMMNFNGTVTIRATVTDSRGRTSNAVDVKVTVINYFTPQISFTLQRSGSASTTLTVTRNARIAPLTVGGKQKNKMIISFKYKEHSATNYTTDTGSAGGTWTTIDNLTNSRANLAATFSTLKTYDIIGKIEDAFTSYEFIATVGTEKFPIAIRPDRVGFGKTPENANAVDSDWVFKYKNKDIQHHQLTLNDGQATYLNGGTDLNAIVETGFYRGDALVNKPTGSGTHGWTWIKVSKHDKGSWVLQEAIDFNGVVSAYRVKKGGSWGAWRYYALRDELKNQINTGWQSAGYAGSYYKRSGDTLAIRFDFKGNGNTFVIASIPSSVWVAPQSYMFEIAEWSVSGADTGHVQVNAGTGQFNILASKNNQQYRGQILLMV